METLGSLSDRLSVVNLKMWAAQEAIYWVRKMSYEEFSEKMNESDSRLELFNAIKNACDLNYQRNMLIDEIDQFVQKLIKGELNPDDVVQLKHKTY